MKMTLPALLPGSTIGILGGGQLGRMLCIAARRMGYRTHVFTPEMESPAGRVADTVTVADYQNTKALSSFASQVQVVTLEFENVPVECAEALEKTVPVRPSPQILYTAQHRGREKAFLKGHGFPVVPFARICGPEEWEAGARQIGVPAVLKTAGFGYDGKGQHKVQTIEQARQVVAGGGDWVMEKFMDFEREVSVLVARGLDGRMKDWGVVENHHANHILDVSFVPSSVNPKSGEKAVQIAHAIAEKLGLVGLLCVEFFVLKNGEVVVNEMAPRPHNSGHWTLEGSVTSQFEQQLRAVCGIALGSTQILAPTAMANILGDAWTRGEPNWAPVLGDPFVKWHSYGKHEPRPGRKMGHLTSTGTTADEAVSRVTSARTRLSNL